MTGNERPEKDYRKPDGNGGIDRRESFHFPQVNAGNGDKGNRKRKTGSYRETQNECGNAESKAG